MAIRLSIYYLNIENIDFVNNYFYFTAKNTLSIEYTFMVLHI